MKPATHIKYTSSENDSRFFRELNRRAEAYLKQTGQTRFANLAMWLKTVFYIGGYWAVWACLTFAVESTSIAIPMVLLLGWFGASTALNIGHDAVHNTFSKHAWINRVIYWVSFNMNGTYGHLWKIGHNLSHHAHANVPGYDVGIEGNNIIRMATHTPWKPRFRYQHIYAPVVYTIYTFFWILIRDWRLIRQTEFSGVTGIKHSRWRYVEIAVIKALYFFYTLYIPMKFSAFSPGQVFGAYVLMHMMLSVYIAFTLFPAHLCEFSSTSQPDETGRIPHSYFKQHLLSTTDFSPRSSVASFFMGGFNSHSVHHLLPHISSTHYPAIAGILQETCKEFDMPYLESTLPKLIASHFRYLKKLGEGEAVVTARSVEQVA